ncbi:potassium transporter TrkG [Rhodovulum sp. DZ06]|uniref:potassium transporter TrkG n=1 Tax=Rhodovulum sp. DZ06 TaxID=3425126 RepID=UPI003D33F430
MRFRGVPLILWFIGALGALMLVPALFAAVERDWAAARMFLYSGIFTLAACAIVGVAMRRPSREFAAARGELLTFAGVFALAPVAAAIPMALAHPPLGAFAAYFEAVSSLTTTGATMIPRPEAAPPALHLWRAMLGWIGGLATLVAVAAVLVPRGLVEMPDGPTPDDGRTPGSGARLIALDRGDARVRRALGRIAPLYAGLTLLLTVLLLAGAGGGEGFLALSHAMGVISTSGITAASSEMGLGGRWAEAAALVFMVLGASRLPWRRGQRGVPALEAARADPELRLLGLTVLMATAWLFGRHWIGALELSGGEEEGIGAALAALWGTVATVVSFATTTGYVSADWVGAQNWSGLDTPTLLLLGLAGLGGGVASTAGGVKLFRAFALFQHARVELTHRAHPHAVERPRRPGGRLANETVTNALVFTMLFLAALSVALTALTMTGMSFDRALTAAIAALANTGPAFPLVTGDPAAYAKLNDGALGVLCAVMVLGRIEVLALIALANPTWWRR